MRRSLIAVALALAVTASVAPSVAALGPGGWDHVGLGFPASAASLDGPVYALNTQAPGVLLAGGAFTSAGGNAHAARLARWTGSTWTAVGPIPLTNGSVRAIAYQAGKLYVGGTFLNAGGDGNADFLAVWDGVRWSPFCNPITATVTALQIVGNTLYVGGTFQDGANLAAADYLVACDLTTGLAHATVGSDGAINSGVYALAADSDGTLYVGGTFVNLAGIPAADHVAAYDGSWHAMGAGPSVAGGAVDTIVRSLATSGTDVYVGTDATNIAGIARADHVARWAGGAWHALGSSASGTDGWFPANSTVNALTTSNGLLLAAGSFQNAGGVATADGIAYFDGRTWRPIGSDGAGNGPAGTSLNAVSVFGGKVYVGGTFTKAGGDARANYLASYSLSFPDARIGLVGAGPFTGSATYSPTGAGQSRTRTLAHRSTGVFYISVVNRGLLPAAFTLKGTGGARGITARYFRGTSEITARVRAGTYSTGTVPARGAALIRMVVSVARASGRSALFVVSARPPSGAPVDAVRAAIVVR